MSDELSAEKDKPKNTLLRWGPAVLGGLLIPILALPSSPTYGYLPVLLPILIATRIKHPLLSFVVSLLLYLISFTIIIGADIAINGFGIGP